MTRTTKLAAAGGTLFLLSLSLAWAQPGGGRGGMMGAEQLLGFLALSPEVALTDDQLLALRAALREPHAEQLAMREALRAGEADRQQMRQAMGELREAMMDVVSAVLTAEQRQVLDDAMTDMGERRGGPGGGGSR